MKLVSTKDHGGIKPRVRIGAPVPVRSTYVSAVPAYLRATAADLYA